MSALLRFLEAGGRLERNVHGFRVACKLEGARGAVAAVGGVLTAAGVTAPAGAVTAAAGGLVAAGAGIVGICKAASYEKSAVYINAYLNDPVACWGQ